MQAGKLYSLIMEQEKIKRQKIRRFTDGLYSKSETDELLKSIRDADMQQAVNDVSEQLWNEAIEKESFVCDIEREKYKEEAVRLLKRINKPQHPKRRRYIWQAACILILMTFGVSIPQLYTPREKEVLYTEVSTTFGEKKEWTLPDGSKVNLNACTTLKYPEQFNNSKERKVELTGEAYFQVSKNEKKPFIIRTKGFDVRVLGTKFNVKAYTENETASVSVESGKVQVDLPEAMTRLTANEQIQINTLSDEYVKRKEDCRNAMAWMQSKLHYNNASLHDIIKDLERYYNCRFKIADNQTFDYRFSGEHDNKSLQAVLQSIEYATGIKSKREGDSILLYR